MKSEKTNKLALRVEKGLALKQKEGLKFADKVLWKNYLATIWPNFSQTGGAAVDFKTHVQLAKICEKKKGKCIFCGVLPVMRLGHLNVR